MPKSIKKLMHLGIDFWGDLRGFWEPKGQKTIPLLDTSWLLEPSGRQDAPKTPPEASQEPPRGLLGWILNNLWFIFGSFLINVWFIFQYLSMIFGVCKRASQECSSCNKTTVFAMFCRFRGMPHMGTNNVLCIAFTACLDMVQ